MKRISLFFIVLFISTHIFSQNIVQWRGENRDGIYNETGLLGEWASGGPELLWHFDDLGVGHASAAVTEKAVYTSGTEGGNGFIVSLDHNGKVIWKTEYGKEWVESWDGVRTTPLIIEEKLYLMSAYGVIYCMNINNGEILWKVDVFNKYGGINIKWGITENLAYYQNKIFCTVGGKEHNVIAINKDSGELIWTNKGNAETSAYCSPTVINHKGINMFVTQTASSILGFNVDSGELLWKHTQTNRYSVHANTPIYQNGQIYIVSGYGKGGVMLKLADDGKSVTELWRNTEIDHKSGSFVVVNNRIYGSVDRGNTWSCIDWNTGKTLFSADIFKSGNIIYSDGRLYCYSEAGEIALLEAKEDKFVVKGQFRVPYGSNQHWAHLVIKNKRLYVRHGESLMVYNIGK